MSIDDNTFRRVDWSNDAPNPSDDDDEHGLPLRSPRGPGLPAADLELLTLAARALGAVRIEQVNGESWLNLHFADGSTMWNWNPLMHRDDTFNLMVRLRFDMEQDVSEVRINARRFPGDWIVERYGDDVFVATCRAVTRAAAEIAVAQGKKQA